MDNAKTQDDLLKEILLQDPDYQATISNSSMARELDIVFANELPLEATPPDELLEGILTTSASSVIYGDSNSGKTFFVIDIACAIARGVDWMGLKTEPGVVLYLAAESPSSVQLRLQAYMKYHGVRVDNFIIVKSPVNLYDSEADLAAITNLIHAVQQTSGKKVRLVIGDTLARLMSGGEENSSKDMGIVVRNVDSIIAKTGVHFCIIHHNGKNALSGARGSSSLRAAIDTEIEVTSLPEGRYAEIKKQRDLASKGNRIGFKLNVIEMGLTKWRKPWSSCVVLSTDAPMPVERESGKRTSPIDALIVGYLASFEVPIEKISMVRHFERKFDGEHSANAIYKRLKKLVESEKVIDSNGLISLRKV